MNFKQVWNMRSRGAHLTAVSSTNLLTIYYFITFRSAIIWNGIGLIIILMMAGMTGLTIYATYKGCDPRTSGQISTQDQVHMS